MIDNTNYENIVPDFRNAYPVRWQIKPDLSFLVKAILPDLPPISAHSSILLSRSSRNLKTRNHFRIIVLLIGIKLIILFLVYDIYWNGGL